MRLHHHPMSPYSRKAYAGILHRGDADVAFSVIDLGSGGLRAPAFLAISPFGKMPVLETGEAGPIVESTSILEYLEERGPRVLLPAGRERVARHFDRIGDHYLVAPCAALWWEPKSEAGKEAPEVARTAWKMLEGALGGSPFLAGDALSLADLGAAIATDYLRRMNVAPPPAIAAWCDRCMATHGMARALAEAEPFVASAMARRAAQL